MKRYRRGADFERRVKKHFEGEGFLVVRSAGSHSPIDLIAMREGVFMLIQVTIDRKQKSIAELDELKAIAKENKCQALFIYRQGTKIVIEELR